MKTIGRNNELRKEIDIWRREKLAVKTANEIMERDIKRLQEETERLDQV